MSSTSLFFLNKIKRVLSAACVASIVLEPTAPVLLLLVWRAQEGSQVAAAVGGVDATMADALFKAQLVQGAVLSYSLAAVLGGRWARCLNRWSEPA